MGLLKRVRGWLDDDGTWNAVDLPRYASDGPCTCRLPAIAVAGGYTELCRACGGRVVYMHKPGEKLRVDFYGGTEPLHEQLNPGDVWWLDGRAPRVWSGQRWINPL